MIRPLLIATLIAVTVAPALADSPAIGARQKAMKGMGEATKAPGAMLKGDAPFDLAKVKASLAVYSATAKAAPALFPDDSKTGGKTEALPLIWEKKADFEAHFAKLDADATAAMTKITDEASFKAEMPKVLSNCGGCHQTYRAKTQ